MPNGCLIWMGAKDWNSYGVTYAFGKHWRASRLFYFLWKGEISEGLLVCHKCDNPECVNPAHLFLGTALDNARDCKSKGRFTGPRGILNGKHKLMPEQVLEIRKRYKPYDRNGNNMYSIAKDYGVHPVTIWDIINRRKWKSVK